MEVPGLVLHRSDPIPKPSIPSIPSTLRLPSPLRALRRARALQSLILALRGDAKRISRLCR